MARKSKYTNKKPSLNKIRILREYGITQIPSDDEACGSLIGFICGETTGSDTKSSRVRQIIAAQNKFIGKKVTDDQGREGVVSYIRARTDIQKRADFIAYIERGGRRKGFFVDPNRLNIITF